MKGAISLYLAGLDVGSSGCKITVCDDRGHFVESHYQPYDSHHTETEHTIDAHDINAAVETVITATKCKPDALGVSSFGESFVLLDENDNILNCPMLYNDPRGSEECKMYDREMVKNSACCAPAALYTLPKLRWYCRNRPDVIKKTRKIFMIGDYIVWLLCGSRVINYSSATRTMGFDVRNLCWRRELFDETGIDVNLLSCPVPDGTVAGVSYKFGLNGAKIISAMHDQNAAALGAGALRDGDAVDGSGSVECITPVISRLPDDMSACDSGIAFLPYELGMYVGCAFSYTGGTALKWFRDNLGGGESYSALDAAVGDEPGNILIMPHFAGAATPYMDPDSRALFWGVTLGTTKYELYRAVMEGVAYEMRVNLELLAGCGIKPSRLLATGGGAKSRVWSQIKADITGLPLTIVDVPEVGAAGVILLMAKQLGLYSSLAEAASVFTREGETLTPDPKRHSRYNELFDKYRKMYALSRELR